MKSVGDWLERNANRLQAAGAIATALAAIAALIVIPYQIAQADRIQRDQTAREIYREFLNLTVQKPDLAGADYCVLAGANQTIAYQAYVEYLLYTSEQMIDTSESWRGPMKSYLADHMRYLCSPEVRDANDDVRALVESLSLICSPEHQCPR
jgi:hypothetical protein